MYPLSGPLVYAVFSVLEWGSYYEYHVNDAMIVCLVRARQFLMSRGQLSPDITCLAGPSPDLTRVGPKPGESICLYISVHYVRVHLYNA